MPPFSLIPPNTLHKGGIHTYSAASRRGPNPTIAVADCFKFTPSLQQDDGTRINKLPSWHRVSAQAAASSIAAGWYSQIHDNHPADHVISNTLAGSIIDSTHPTLPCPTSCFKHVQTKAPSQNQDDVSCLMLKRNAVPGESVDANRSAWIVLSTDNSEARLEEIGCCLKEDRLFIGSTWSVSKMPADRLPPPVKYEKPFQTFPQQSLRETSALGVSRFRRIPAPSPAPSTTSESVLLDTVTELKRRYLFPRFG